jgi:hypothetical protein
MPGNTTMKHVTIQTTCGPQLVPVPNVVMDGDGFYVSYNSHDVGIYGCATTALVLGQMQKFYILKGDHRGQYADLISRGFDACLEYYKANIMDAHRASDQLAA